MQNNNNCEQEKEEKNKRPNDEAAVPVLTETKVIEVVARVAVGV